MSQLVNEIEEAYTGEEPKMGSLCHMPKTGLVVSITKMVGNYWNFYVHNGDWEGLYDNHSKKWRVQDEDADYLMSQSYNHLSADDYVPKAYIDPWRDAGNMMEVDLSLLSAECKSQWYLSSGCPSVQEDPWDDPF